LTLGFDVACASRWSCPLVVAHGGGQLPVLSPSTTSPASSSAIGGSWDYTHAALRSSSMFEMSPLMHWFTGNIGYHHVHHLNHRIPFYRLPEAMAAHARAAGPRSARPGARPTSSPACAFKPCGTPTPRRWSAGKAERDAAGSKSRSHGREAFTEPAP
jgi:hypothetical protein